MTKKYSLIILFLVGLLATLVHSNAKAQPANDNPAGAITVTLGNNASLTLPTNATVTTTPGAPSGCNNSGTADGGWGAGKKDVWYSFTPTAGTSYVINTASTSDLQMAAYILSGGVYTIIGCNGDGFDGGDPKLVIACATATPIFIRIWRFSDPASNVTFDLNIQTDATLTAGDNPNTAISLNIGCNTFAGSTSTSFTETRGQVSNPSCGGFAFGAGSANSCRDIWYRIDNTVNAQQFTVNITSSDGTSNISAQLYKQGADCTSLTAVSCVTTATSNSISATPTANGDVYYVRVWDFNCNGTTDYTINSTSSAVSSLNLDAAADGTTRNLTCGQVINFYDDGGPGSASSTWYSNVQNRTITFTAPAGKRVKITFRNVFDSRASTGACPGGAIVYHPLADGVENIHLDGGGAGSDTELADYLTLYEGTSTSGAVISVYTGDTRSYPNPGVVLSDGTSMTINFKAVGNNKGYGWEAVVECADPPVALPQIDVPCDGTLVPFDLVTLTGSSTLAENTSYQVTVCSAGGVLFEPVGFDITDQATWNNLFNLNNNSDYLYIYNGNTTNDSPMQIITGSHTNSTNCPGVTPSTPTGGTETQAINSFEGNGCGQKCLTFKLVTGNSCYDPLWTARTGWTGELVCSYPDQGNGGGPNCGTATEIIANGYWAGTNNDDYGNHYDANENTNPTGTDLSMLNNNVNFTSSCTPTEVTRLENTLWYHFKTPDICFNDPSIRMEYVTCQNYVSGTASDNGVQFLVWEMPAVNPGCPATGNLWDHDVASGGSGLNGSLLISCADKVKSGSTVTLPALKCNRDYYVMVDGFTGQHCSFSLYFDHIWSTEILTTSIDGSSSTDICDGDDAVFGVTSTGDVDIAVSTTDYGDDLPANATTVYGLPAAYTPFYLDKCDEYLYDLILSNNSAFTNTTCQVKTVYLYVRAKDINPICDVNCRPYKKLTVRVWPKPTIVPVGGCSLNINATCTSPGTPSADLTFQYSTNGGTTWTTSTNRTEPTPQDGTAGNNPANGDALLWRVYATGMPASLLATCGSTATVTASSCTANCPTLSLVSAGSEKLCPGTGTNSAPFNLVGVGSGFTGTHATTQIEFIYSTTNHTTDAAVYGTAGNTVIPSAVTPINGVATLSNVTLPLPAACAAPQVYYIYTRLSPIPADPACRPWSKTQVTVYPRIAPVVDGVNDCVATLSSVCSGYTVVANFPTGTGTLNGTNTVFTANAGASGLGTFTVTPPAAQDFPVGCNQAILTANFSCPCPTITISAAPASFCSGGTTTLTANTDPTSTKKVKFVRSLTALTPSQVYGGSGTQVGALVTPASNVATLNTAAGDFPANNTCSPITYNLYAIYENTTNYMATCLPIAVTTVTVYPAITATTTNGTCTATIDGFCPGYTVAIDATAAGEGTFDAATGVFTANQGQSGTATFTVTSNIAGVPAACTSQTFTADYNCPVVGTCTPPATPTASNPAAICAGATLPTLTVSSAASGTLKWYANNGGVPGALLTTGTTFTPTLAQVNSPGVTTFFVRDSLNNNLNCKSEPRAVVVTINPQPTASIPAVTPFCTPGSATVTVTQTNGNTYAWVASGGGTISGATTGTSVTVTSAGTYTVTVTGTGGCTATASVAVTTNAPPTVTASNDGPKCAGQNLALSSTPAGATSYAWTGPNSFTSTSQNPTITAATTAANGVYTVTVTATNGCTGTATTSVVINPLPTVSSIEGSLQICDGSGNGQPSSTTLTAVTSGATITSYAWTPGGGTTASITASAAGTYTVTVTATGGCTATRSVSVSTNSAICGTSGCTPPATPTVSNPAAICAGATLPTLSASGSASGTFKWYANNGGVPGAVLATGSTFTPTLAQVTSPGVTTFFVRDSLNNSTNCKSSPRAVIVTINPQPTASIPAVSPFCTPGSTTVAVTQTNANTYAWAATNGGTISGSTTGASVIVTVAGTYTVTVTGTGGCTATASTSVVANATPVVTAGNNGPFCVGAAGPLNLTSSPSAATSYSWSGPSGYTSTTEDPTRTGPITAAMGGTYNVTVTNGSGASACSASAATTVVVNALPSAGIGGNTTVCSSGSGTTTILTATGGTTYSWSNSATTASISNVGSGSYSVTVTNAAGCTGTASVSVSSQSCGACITPVTDPNAGQDAAICANIGQASLSANTPTVGTGAWSIFTYPSADATAPAIENTTTPTTNVTSLETPGDYIFAWTISDPGGNCPPKVDYVKITVNPVPVPTLSNDGPKCAGQTVTLTATGGGTYTWSAGATPGAGGTATVTTAGTYTVTVTLAGSCTATATTSVSLPAAPQVTSVSGTLEICGDGTDNTVLTANTSGAVSSYAWSTNTGAISGSTTNNTVTATKAGTYTVTVTNAGGCTATGQAVVVANATLCTPTGTCSTIAVSPLVSPNLCGGATGANIPTLSATTNGTGAIDFVVSPVALSNADLYGGLGTFLGTATPVAGVATLPSASITETLDALNSCSPSTYYIYAIFATNDPACQLSSFTSVNVYPEVLASANDGSCVATVTGTCPDYVITASGFTAAQGSFDANSGIFTANAGQSGAVMFTITNPDANAPAGCESIQVSANYTCPTCTIEAGLDQTICLSSGSTTNILATAIGNANASGVWSVSSPTGSTLPTIATPNQLGSSVSGLAVGTYIFKWTVTSTDNSCQGNDNLTVYVYPDVAAEAGVASPICEGETITLGATKPTAGLVGTWTVSPSAGVMFSDVNSATPVVSGLTNANSPYTFTWTVINPNLPASLVGTACQTASDNVQVQVKPTPTAPNATNPATPICVGAGFAGVTATGAAGATFAWFEDMAGTDPVDAADGTVSGAGNATFTPATALSSNVGTYTFYVNQTVNGCTSPTKAVMWSVVSAPIADIDGDPTICEGTQTTLLASGGTQYLWSTTATTASIAATGGTYTVTVTNAGGCTATNTFKVTESACNGTNNYVDVQLLKTIKSNNIVTLFDTVIYQITLKNTGNITATGVQVVDTLPNGLVYLDDNGGSTTTNNGNIVLWNVGSLVPDNVPINLQIRAIVVQTGPIQNIAQVSATNENDIDSTPNNDIDTEDDYDDAPLLSLPVDLQLTKTVDDNTVVVGQNIVYTLVIKNTSAVNATGVEVSDVLPSGLTYVGDNGGAATSNSGNAVTWMVGSLNAGASATLQITANVTGTGTITNFAQISDSDQPDVDSTPNNDSNNTPDEDDEDDVPIVSEPTAIDLEVSKAVNTTLANPGDLITYVVSVYNNNTVIPVTTATGVVLEDVLPAGLTYASSLPTGAYNNATNKWTVGSLAPGETKYLTITAQVTATNGKIVNGAEVTSADQPDVDSQPDENPLNNAPDQDDEDTVSINITNNTALYNVSGTAFEDVDNDDIFDATDPVIPGVIVTLYNGSGVAVGTTVTDGSGNYLFTNVPPGTGYYVGFETPDNLSPINPLDTNVGTDGDDSDINPTTGNTPPFNVVDADVPNVDAGYEQQPIDIELTKTLGSASVQTGSIITYSILVENKGPGNATGVEVTDYLPAGLDYISSVPSASTNAPQNILTWNVGNLDAGESKVVTVTATVIATSGSVKNSAEVSDADQPDIDSTPEEDTTIDPADEDDEDFVITPVVNDVPTYNVSGTAFEDLDNDDIFDPTDAVIPNVLVTLYDGSGTVVATTFTDGSGNYLFTDVPAGTYYVGFGTPDNLDPINPLDANVGTDGDDSDINPTTGNTPTFNVVDADVPNVDAGYEQQPIDISLEKTVNASVVAPGDNIIYTLSVSNVGPGNATGVKVTDNLPAGLTFVSANPTNAYSNGVWNVGSLDAGETKLLNITAKVNANATAGNITNYAEVTDADQPNDIDSDPAEDDIISPDDEDDEDTVNIEIVPENVYNISGTVFEDTNDDNLSANENGIPDVLVYLYDGNGTLIDITVTDENGDYIFTNVPPGDYYVDFTTPDDYSPVDQLDTVVGGDDDDSDATPNNGQTPTFTLVDQDIPNVDAGYEITPIDLSLIKDVVDNEVAVGENATFILVLSNDGPGNATNVVVSDILPAGLTFVSAIPSNAYNATTGEWSVNSLASGASTALQITATLTQAGPVTNVAQVTAADQPDVDSTPDNDDPTEDDQDEETITSPDAPIIDLELEKTVNTSSVIVGQNITYTLTLENKGPNDATGVQVTDYLPAGLTFVSASPNAAYNSSTGVWTVGNLAAGSVVSLQITATVTQVGNLVNNAEVTDADQPDIDSTPGEDNNIGDEDDEDSVPVNGTPNEIDLELTKSANATSVQLGTTFNYLLEITNQGPANATGVQVTDYLPAGLTFVSASPSAVYNSSTGVWTVGNLAVGETKFLSITVIVSAIDGLNGQGTINNQAEVTAADQPDVDSTPGEDNTIGNEDDEDDAPVDVIEDQIYTVSGTVFSDPGIDGTNAANPEDPGIRDVEVTLYNENGDIVAVTTTDNNGEYEFILDTPGNYYVGFETPNGYDTTATEVNNDPNIEDLNDSDSNGGITPIFEVSDNNPDVPDVDAGFVQLGNLSGTVFVDEDNDGLDDDGIDVPNVTVTLYDEDGNIVGVTTTDNDGNYEFTDLYPGDYTVIFTDIPNGYDIIEPSPDNDASTDGTTPNVTVPPGGEPTLDAGIEEPMIIIGVVFEDDNGNGLNDDNNPVPSVDVTLYDEDGHAVETTVTDNDGGYVFDNLPPGTYYVGFDNLPPTTTIIVPSDDSDANQTDGITPTVTGQSGDVINDGVDAGIIEPASIEGTVFGDTNQNDQDDDDIDYSNVTVVLYDGNGNIVATTTTDENGDYLFDGLMPGDYSVVFDVTDSNLPNDAQPVDPNQGGDVIDSDIDLQGNTPSVTLQSGDHVTDIDAGFAGNSVIAEDDNANTFPNTPVDISIIDNDSDPNNDDFSVLDITTPPSNGTVINNNDGTVTYIPNDGFVGTDTFTYVIIDEYGNTDTAIVIVYISQGPVAIELLQFTGTVETQGNLLKWATAAEINNHHFTLEHSLNGTEFTLVNTQNGAGTTNIAHAYEYMHKNAPNGVNYYRLSSTDYDGTVQQHGIITLVRGETQLAIVNVFPVPVINSVSITFTNNKVEETTLHVYDVKGRLVETQKVQAQAGVNTIKLNTTNYAAGLYFVSIANNQSQISTKFTKEK